MNKKIIYLAVLVTGFTGLYFWSHQRNLDSGRSPSSTGQVTQIKLQKPVESAKAKSESNIRAEVAVESIDMKQYDRKDLSEADVRKEFEAHGYDIISIKKDPVYGYRVQAQAKQTDPHQVVQEMKSNWENNQDKVLTTLNGREIELTAEDRAAIAKLKEQMPGL